MLRGGILNSNKSSKKPLDAGMKIDVTMDPGIQEAFRKQEAFDTYCLTGRHPSLKKAGASPLKRQRKITEFFKVVEVRKRKGGKRIPPMTNKERDLHRMAESCSSPRKRNILANQLHEEFVKRRNWN